MSEFDLIRNYFSHLGPIRPDVVLGIGDDGAVIDPHNDSQLVLAVDTMVAGVHFPLTTPASAIGHKSLAVNLSDLAAMGADPAWALIAITLPSADENWIREYCLGFDQLARRYSVQCIGGDTTKGPLTVSVTVGGWVPKGHAVQRASAKPGDLIYVTGTIGDAGLGLKEVMDGVRVPSQEYFTERLNRPEPRVTFAKNLRRFATSAIDVSDGLIADLEHILAASGVGASIHCSKLPLRAELAEWANGDWSLPLTSGDDYELCFTVAPHDREEFERTLGQFDYKITHIGQVESTQGLRIFDANDRPLQLAKHGYNHFS